ncbi:MAG: hypothetical protein QW759_02895, partial [Candidatus Micrarchaeaceae archaeon]
ASQLFYRQCNVAFGCFFACPLLLATILAAIFMFLSSLVYTGFAFEKRECIRFRDWIYLKG